MAVLKILRMGHPVLLRPADAIPAPAEAEIRRLGRDMIETMEDAAGAGLAAPQVGASLRMIVFKVAADGTGDAEEGQAQQVRLLLNPEITPLGEETILAWEGCLSIPGLRGAVPRFARIRYRGQDLDGNTIEVEAAGFHARVVQHEVDHLDGILYPMRMEDFRLFGFNEEIMRAETGQATAGRETD